MIIIFLSLTVGSRWYPSATVSITARYFYRKKKERKQDQKNFQAVHFAASYLPGNFIKILVIALLKGIQVAEHSCIQSFMLPWKLRKNQILPVTQNLSSVYFSLAKFQLVSCNLSLAMIWQMKYTHKLPKLCPATLKHPHSQNREFNLINKNREEKSLRHVTMVAKLLDLNKAWSCKYGRKKKNKKTIWHAWLLCMIALRNKMVAHNFPPSLDNANGRLCHDRLLRSRNLATMVTWRHSSPLYGPQRL